MSSQELPAVLQLKPVISYPREAQVSKTYLVSIDVQLSTPNASWDFPEEEYTIGFILNTSPYFTCEPLHDIWPTIVLHRYGGTYGPAEFLLTAADHEIERGQISITLVNGWGIPMTHLELPCEVNLESSLQSVIPEITLPASQDTTENYDERPPIQVSPKELEKHESLVWIAAMLAEAGWAVVGIADTVVPSATGIAIRESANSTRIDFLLWLNGEPIGRVIKEGKGRRLASQSETFRFTYEMQGEEIHFINTLEPEARSRIVFHFHRPETFALWLEQAPVGTPNDLNDLLRSRLRRMPSVSEMDVSANEVEVITKLESSLAQNRPRALIQMADSSSMIMNSMHRLLKFGGARRILYLVDSKSIELDILDGLEPYVLPGTSQYFLEVYKTCASDHPDPSSNVYIMNIEDVYRLLSRSASEDDDPDNDATQTDISIAYQLDLPSDFFDVVFFVECFDKLRQQYRPLLDYFDAFLIGIAEVEDQRTLGLFNNNLVYKQPAETPRKDVLSFERRLMKVDRVDFAIITTLSEEYDAIYTRFRPKLYKHSSSQNTYGISYVQRKDGKQCVGAITRTSRPGNDASQQLANNIIADLDPQILLVVGIGGGVPDNDFTLGDVIVSSRIHNFDLNAIKANKTSYDVGGGIHPLISDITANRLFFYQKQFAGWNSVASIKALRPSLQLTDELLQNLIDPRIDEEWRKKVVNAFRWHFDARQRGARPPIFLTGPIASSNTLIRSDVILTKWLEDARSIRAVEMETAGVYQAAQHTQRQYPVMSIRGISDIIGFERDDDWKLYACHTAASFAYAFVASDIPETRLIDIAASATPIYSYLKEDTANATAIKIFTIYADEDETDKKRLYTHISPYALNGMLDRWDKRRIGANLELMQQEIDNHIDTSQIVLLLISPNFPEDGQCTNDMRRALKRHIDHKIIIIPIYIRPTDWPEAPFDGLLKLPHNDKPVSEWSNPDSAWYDVAKDIRKACEAVGERQNNP